MKDARILVAPLDWGLGHATRCIPIIRRLVERGAVPILGADNGPLAILRQEFPDLEYVRLPGAIIQYGKGESQFWSMARQFPQMLRSVREESVLFERLRSELRLDAVISDQRFGLRSADLPSILITHQVFPFTPFAQGALRKLNLRSIALFDRCWIMDEPDAPGLAGELSHGPSLPTNTRYIGTVSRMNVHSLNETKKRYCIVAVISGPEPHRTMLDELLTEQLQLIEGEHLLVRGLPNGSGTEHHGQLTTAPHMQGTELAQHMAQADLVVSRSGYTTLMDLAALGQNALVIPTPGQAEQEYLGELHTRSGRFLVQKQSALNLRIALGTTPTLRQRTTATGHPLLEAALDELVTFLR